MASPKTTIGGIELLDCHYWAVCHHDGCDERGTVIVRYIDNQFRPLGQRTYCSTHAEQAMQLAGPKARLIDSRLKKWSPS